MIKIYYYCFFTAVRNKTGFYYLNGNWRIDFPRSIDFAGTRFKYDRQPQEFDAPDILTALGPTDESLFIVVSTVFRYTKKL